MARAGTERDDADSAHGREPNAPLARLLFVTMSTVRPKLAAAAQTFDEFYRGTYRSMVLLARATTQSEEAAEEIVQDAFVQLYQRWDRVETPAAWMRRAVISLCTSWVRHTVQARSAPVAMPDRPTQDPDAVMDVWSALSKLPPRQRAAVVLRYLEDLPERDIAHALGCRVGTVKSTLSRARQSLRTELTDARV